MAGRPPKSVAQLKSEKKSHRTKKELAVREAAEKKLLTGKKLIETGDVKADEIAHAEFGRVKKLLMAIEKNDEIYGAAVRRYCFNKSRLANADKEVELLKGELEALRGSRQKFEDSGDIAEYYRLLTRLEDSITKKEQISRSYRAEMNDFEKENCMTIKSSLRVIPKQPETKSSSLKEALSGG